MLSEITFGRLVTTYHGYIIDRTVLGMQTRSTRRPNDLRLAT